MLDNFSILIPIYNFDITTLVDKLYTEASKLSKKFEILLIDDDSSKEFKEINSNISEKENVAIFFLEKNIGRAKIRNLLFEKAKYENCLILDCDVQIVKNNFIEEYFNNLDNNVVVGGHIYSEDKPKNEKKRFHWLYGSNVEVQNIKARLKNPYSSFMTNSFAITKTIFNEIKFNEFISEYGHEDTLFGIALEKQKIEIKHILNPVIHIGLDDEISFYKKQENAIKNLAKLYFKEEYKKDLANIKLIKFYNSPLKYTLGFIKLYSKFNSKDKSKLIDFSLWKLEKFNLYMNELSIQTS